MDSISFEFREITSASRISGLPVVPSKTIATLLKIIGLCRNIKFDTEISDRPREKHDYFLETKSLRNFYFSRA